MTEFRPQKMASRPIFLIAFTVLALAVTGNVIYDSVVNGNPIQWSSMAFGLGVVVLLWYSRVMASYFVRVADDYVEWRVSRLPVKRLDAADINLIEVNRLSVEFVTKNGVIELSLANFDGGRVRLDVVEAIAKWAKSKGIKVEELAS